MNKCIDCKYLNGSSSHCNSEVFCSKEIDELNADAYQQGREDAIQELCKIIEKNALCVNGMVSMANVYHYAEQMKE